MRKKLNIIISCTLAITLIFMSLNINAYAADENTAEETVQQVLDESDVDAYTEDLTTDEYVIFWDQEFSAQLNVTEFNSKLSADGFIEDTFQDDMAVKIIDSKNALNYSYFYYKIYENTLGEKVAAMFISFPGTSPTIYAQKINVNNEISDYYESIINSKQSRASSTWWICTLGSTLACTLYSAMLMALPIASVIVNATCTVVFGYACG